MSLAFYMDHHVPTAVTEGLRRRSVDVVTAFEDGAADWDDEPILQRATQLGRSVYTQDDDFLSLAHQWLRDGREFAGVVYSRQLGITVGQAVRDLELMAHVLEPDDTRNRIEFIPF